MPYRIKDIDTEMYVQEFGPFGVQFTYDAREAVQFRYKQEATQVINTIKVTDNLEADKC